MAAISLWLVFCQVFPPNPITTAIPRFTVVAVQKCAHILNVPCGIDGLTLYVPRYALTIIPPYDGNLVVGGAFIVVLAVLWKRPRALVMFGVLPVAAIVCNALFVTSLLLTGLSGSTDLQLANILIWTAVLLVVLFHLRMKWAEVSHLEVAETHASGARP